MTANGKITPRPGDALIVVDVQNDFLPGGALAVADGDRVLGPLNQYIERFSSQSLPVFATRDWHPANHCSFEARGGQWPAHCIAETDGARFAAELKLPANAIVVSKATLPDQEAYSGFQGTELARQLHENGIERLFIGGLATDYCVLDTVKDALAGDFEVYLLTDAIRAVEVDPGDGEKAITEMTQAGARKTRLEQITTD